MRTVPAQAALVVNAREDSLQRVLERGCWRMRVRFGVRGDNPGFRARGDSHAFDVLKAGVLVGRVEWSLLGEHKPNERLGPPSLRQNMWA